MKALRESGELEEALQAAASLAQAEIDSLKAAGYPDHAAKEVALHQFILLKPGPGDAPEDEQDRELAALEREYQANPPVPRDEGDEELRNP